RQAVQIPCPKRGELYTVIRGLASAYQAFTGKLVLPFFFLPHKSQVGAKLIRPAGYCGSAAGHFPALDALEANQGVYKESIVILQGKYSARPGAALACAILMPASVAVAQAQAGDLPGLHAEPQP